MSTRETGVQEWQDIHWAKVERDVFTLQRRIYQASRAGVWLPCIGTVTIQFTEARRTTERRVSMTRIGNSRSRVRAKDSCTVLKTSTMGDCRAEFNIKNFPDVFVDGEEVIVTEKLHGTNCRIGYIRTDPQHVEFMAGSRATRKKEANAAGKPSLYWKPMNDAIRNVLWNATEPKGDGNAIVFGEIYGAKIQDLTYGLQTQAFRAFDISVNGVYLDYDHQKELFDTWGVETVPVLYRGPFSKEIVAALTDGPTTLCDPEKAGKFKGREGIVVKPVKERYSDKLPHSGRVILKSISIDYLERKGGSEFH